MYLLMSLLMAFSPTFVIDDRGLAKEPGTYASVSGLTKLVEGLYHKSFISWKSWIERFYGCFRLSYRSSIAIETNWPVPLPD